MFDDLRSLTVWQRQDLVQNLNGLVAIPAEKTYRVEVCVSMH